MSSDSEEEGERLNLRHINYSYTILPESEYYSGFGEFRPFFLWKTTIKCSRRIHNNSRERESSHHHFMYNTFVIVFRLFLTHEGNQ
jgi:hypothetical protein